ncbi:translation initiation factor eIF2B subunit alpha-like [Halichondria panicea]|uniref:translation initiation factor eIF2B subunit alpha-like n=1 Tax=Halichondria panicea TaxID=6063 RepID=UPI00312B70E0
MSKHLDLFKLLKLSRTGTDRGVAGDLLILHPHGLHHPSHISDMSVLEPKGSNSDTIDWVRDFREHLDKSQPNGLSEAVVAIKTLLQLIKNSEAGTIAGLQDEIKEGTKVLTEGISSIVSVSSGCELFVRFITLSSLLGEEKDFQEIKRLLVERGNLYIQRVANSRQKIAQVANPFIRDGTTVLVHSLSRVVFRLLFEASASGKRLKIFITTCAVDETGGIMQRWLEEAKIPSKLVLDSAVGFLMEKVDVVVVGAEGVAESGGIINKIGTYQIAVMAKTLNKPFYVVTESFKFVRVFPLKQDDLPNEEKYCCVDSSTDSHPTIDYTPPHYISLLFTDLGVLTPSAVSDELLKLYK